MRVRIRIIISLSESISRRIREVMIGRISEPEKWKRKSEIFRETE